MTAETLVFSARIVSRPRIEVSRQSALLMWRMNSLK